MLKFSPFHSSKVNQGKYNIITRHIENMDQEAKLKTNVVGPA